MPLYEATMADFLRIFSDPWDTVWWLGRSYYDKHGDNWPGQETPPPGFRNPEPKDALCVVIVMAIFLSLLRAFFEGCIASPIASFLGIKQCKKHDIVIVPVLEEHLKAHSYSSPGEGEVKELSRLAGLTVRETEIWIRRRQQTVLSTRHTKFVESCWRFVFYSAMFGYGLVSLWDEDYLWDTRHCWLGYPIDIWTVKDKIYWYYMIELGYYTAGLVSQFYEVKRKDFLQMFIHHVSTVVLIGMSFITSRTRIGALVMLVHDFSDITLELCKMAKYTKREELANVLFGIFALCFFLSRIIYYPYRLLYSALFETASIANTDGPSLFLLVSLLCVLFLLHIFWFSLICKLALTFVTQTAEEREEPKDLRSEDEAPSSSGEDVKKKE